MRPNRKHLLVFTMLCVSGWAHAQLAAGSSPAAERIKLTLVDNQSTYTTVGEQNDYVNLFRLSQPNGSYQLTAGMLNEGDNYIVFHRIDDQGVDSTFARINLNAVKTVPESEVIDGLSFTSNPPSSQTTITQAMLPDNWGTNGSNLIWQTSGYAYISGQGGLTYTIPAGYSDATVMFYISVGSNARGGYFAYNLNSEGWTVGASASAGSSSTIVIGGLNSGDVISFYGVRVYNNQYQLYQSPDIGSIYILTMPNSYLPTIDVSPTVSYKDGNNWGTPTTLGQGQTYNPNDTVNLYNLGTVIDAFYAETDQNSHSDYYNYNVTFSGNVVLPSGSSTGVDFYSSADFSGCTTSDPSSATMTGYNGWTFNESYAYSSSNIISVYIQYYGAIVFTMPDSFMGNSVTVTVTTSTGSDGAGILYVNDVLHTFTAGETYTWTVPVSANGTIEFKSDGTTYSADINSIVIRSGNGSALNAPMLTGTSQNNGIYNQPGLKKDASIPVIDSKKERINNVKIND